MVFGTVNMSKYLIIIILHIRIRMGQVGIMQGILILMNECFRLINWRKEEIVFMLSDFKVCTCYMQ
jgi:hypothetical protein